MRAALVLAFLIAATPGAWPASFSLDSVVDAPDAAPGDGTCATADGACSLRAAIQETNALAGADAITLPAGTYPLTIPGNGEDQSATGDLDLTDDVTLTGAGPVVTIVDGGSQSRLLQILSGTVLIEGLTLRNGNAMQDDCAPAPQIEQDCGGAICQAGGGLTLRDVVVRDSVAFFGGGICLMAGALALDAATVSDNTAVIGGGIMAGVDVGPLDVSVADSTVSGNTATGNGGGGIASAASMLTITGSTVSGNRAPSASLGGGGIWTVGGGTTLLRNTTVSGNSTSARGGGILNVAFCTDPFMPLCSTGGAISLNNVTISANTDGGAGAGVLNANLGNPYAPEPVLTASNSLFAGNRPRDCGGRLTSAGHDLLLNLDGCTVIGDTTGNVTGVDPLLGPLADNGGPTETHALHGPAAVDAGDPAPAGSGGACEATDQRGVPRPFGAGCDIGGYESQCGNGVVDPGEECEGGGPGCDPNCTFTACGNGVLTAGEQCDDGNTAAGDCCSPTCQYEGSGGACPDEGNACTDDVCDGAGRCLHPLAANGTPCDYGDDCTSGDFCRDGSCRPGSFCGGRFCNGFSCDDGDPCTQGDFCFMNLCLPASACGECTTCEPDVGCVPANEGAPCDDGNSCTVGEHCAAGTCTAGSPCHPCAACQPGVGCVVPPASCTSAAPGGAALSLKHPPHPGRDGVRFRWRSAAPIAKADFGDPTSVTPYRLCVFDGMGNLTLGADAPAGGSCGAAACWREKEHAFSYRDADRTPEGLARIELAEGDPGRIKVQGNGPNLPLGSLPLATPVRARFSRTDTNACWEASFSTNVRKNDGARFKAKSD